jgi:hypothetical protein
MALSTISGQLIVAVRNMLVRCLQEYANAPVDQRPLREGTNCSLHEEDALAAYILAVAAVEAFINEFCVAEHTKILTSDSAFWDLKERWRERLNLKQKLVLVPLLLHQQTFRRGQQPYEDMEKLIDIRNGLLHYKMKPGIPKPVRYLIKKGIPLSYVKEMEPGIHWPAALSCTEGIRWAHNTACRTAQALTSFVPDDKAQTFAMKDMCEVSFREIDDATVSNWLEERGIDPKS